MEIWVRGCSHGREMLRDWGGHRGVLLFSAPSQGLPLPRQLPAAACQGEGFRCRQTMGGFIRESAGNGMAEVMNSNEERGEC